MTAPDLISLIDPQDGRPGTLSRFAPSPFRSRPFGLRSLTRRLTLKLSLWLGYRRQRIARLVRSADVKRGQAKSRLKGKRA